MHQNLVMSMADVSESDIVDALRVLISRRKLKLVDIAETLGIPYRSLQNYMYKKARMPWTSTLGCAELLASRRITQSSADLSSHTTIYSTHL